MGKLSRNKGATFERLVANMLKEVYSNARRGVGQTQSSGNGADVEGTPFWVECKHGKQPNIRAAYKQAIEARKETNDAREVLVVTRRDREPIMATIELKTLIEILCKYYGL